MKKYSIYILFAILSMSIVQSQTPYDALKISQTELLGTARYVGLGGAYGALGGDVSALKDNPAGIGVFRSTEFSATYNIFTSNSISKWNGIVSSDNKYGDKFTNYGYILSMPNWGNKKGLLFSNLSFTFNKVKNFDRHFFATSTPLGSSFTDFLADFTTESLNTAGLTDKDLSSGKDYNAYDNPNISWLSLAGFEGYLINPPTKPNGSWMSAMSGTAIPNVYMHESGSIDEYSIGWGGNFNNNLFVGFNFNILNGYYNLESSIGEKFSSTNDFFQLTNFYSYSSTAMNMKFGAIYLPSNNLRIGVSIHTPTFGNSVDERTNFNLSSSKSTKPFLPEKDYTQKIALTSPMQAQLSAAYMFGKKGLISAEYDFVNYKGMKFTIDGSTKGYEDENRMMGKILSNGHLFKFGSELKPTSRTALRIGYALALSTFNADYNQGKSLRLNSAFTNSEYLNQFATNYISLGAGYRTQTWFFDVAYMLKMQNDDYYPYQSLVEMSDGSLKNMVKPANVITNVGNIIFTLGFRM